jgi:hypothetical protein
MYELTMEKLTDLQKERVKNQLMQLGYEEATGYVYRAKYDPSKNVYTFDVTTDFLEGVEYRFEVKTEQDRAELESVRAVIAGTLAPLVRTWNREEGAIPSREIMEMQIYYDVQAAKARELLFYFLQPTYLELKKIGFDSNTDRILLADKTWPASTFLIVKKNHALTASSTGFLIDISLKDPKPTILSIAAGKIHLAEINGQLRYDGPALPVVFSLKDGPFPSKTQMLEILRKEESLKITRKVTFQIESSEKSARRGRKP